MLAEWALSQPELVARSEAGPRGSARKAWRFVGEMDEIADAFAAAGMPDGFHRAAADVYRGSSDSRMPHELPSLADARRRPVRRHPRLLTAVRSPSRCSARRRAIAAGVAP